VQRICLPGVRQQRDFSTELTAALLLDRGNARSLDDRLPSTLGRTAILLIRRRTDEVSDDLRSSICHRRRRQLLRQNPATVASALPVVIMLSCGYKTSGGAGQSSAAMGERP